jgi:hypothetical protein
MKAKRVLQKNQANRVPAFISPKVNLLIAGLDI